jgi:hypothetical protein
MLSEITKNAIKPQFLRLFAGLLAAALCLWCSTARQCEAAASRQSTEYEVKAAFLYNFAKFTEWPANTFSGPDEPLIFGILGHDPFGGNIDAATKRTVNGRPVQVRRFSDVREVGKCHILFISSSEAERLETILHALRSSRILLISDISGFAERGGMINFIMQENSVGFKINADAVSRAGITLHSRLLNIAIIVHDEPE